MYYELGNITSFSGLLTSVNVMTDFYFGPVIVAAFFLVMFISMKNYEAPKAFAASSFLTTILCFMFWLLGLTSINHLMITSISTMVSLFILEKGEGEI